MKSLFRLTVLLGALLWGAAQPGAWAQSDTGARHRIGLGATLTGHYDGTPILPGTARGERIWSPVWPGLASAYRLRDRSWLGASVQLSAGSRRRANAAFTSAPSTRPIARRNSQSCSVIAVPITPKIAFDELLRVRR